MSETSASDGLRIYFGFRSPYSRLGLHKVAALETAVPITLLPFTGPAQGAAFLDPTGSPPKLAYYAEDAPRMTARMGLPFAFPQPFEIGAAERANRAFYAARGEGLGLAFALAASDARWGEGRDLTDAAVIEEVARGVGVRGDLTAARPDEEAEDRAQLEADGAFGVPFAVLEWGGTRQRFWGQDRFDLLAEALQS